MIDYITKGERDKYDDAQNAVQLHHNHSIMVIFFSKQHLTRLPYWPFTCCICATYEYNTSHMERDIERQRHVGRTGRTRRQTGGRSETNLPPPPPPPLLFVGMDIHTHISEKHLDKVYALRRCDRTAPMDPNMFYFFRQTNRCLIFLQIFAIGHRLAFSFACLFMLISINPPRPIPAYMSVK